MYPIGEFQSWCLEQIHVDMVRTSKVNIGLKSELLHAPKSCALFMIEGSLWQDGWLVTTEVTTKMGKDEGREGQLLFKQYL